MSKYIFILLLLITNQIFGQNKCIGDTLTLWTTSNPTWSYKWIVEPTIAFYGQSTSTIRIDSLQGDLTVFVEVENSSGCIGETQIYITVEDCGWSIYFPNAIVPDGVNITWFPKYHNVIIRELTIWDRYGHVQWTWKGDEFRGINDNGNSMQGDVYTYLCVYSPQNKKVQYQKIGKVVIIR
jgi:hypothetical protein